MSEQRRWLVSAIKRQLLPELARRGFAAFPLPTPKNGSSDREFVVSLPFGLFRRRSSRGVQQVEIQLASYGRAAFSINVGVIPDAGVKGILGEHLEPEEVLVTWLEEYFGFYAEPRSFKPFAVHRSWWSRRETTEADYNELVSHVVGFLPEVERALAEGTVGPHVRRIKLGPSTRLIESP